MYSSFVGSSPNWFKNVIFAFLVLSYPIMLAIGGHLGSMVVGWAFIAMFILAMALMCYPHQSGGLLTIGCTSVWLNQS